MAYVDVHEAAQMLNVNVQRTRALIASGALQATKVAGVWLVDPESVHAYVHRRHDSGGRPLSAQSAWAALLSDMGRRLTDEIIEAFELNSEQRRRIRALTQRETDDWRWLARNRATVVHADVRPAYLTRIAATPAVVQAGLSTITDHHLDLTEPAQSLDVYTDARTAEVLVSTYAIHAAASGNLTLRTVQLATAAQQLVLDRVAMPRSVVAVDLIEQRDERTSRVGRDLLRHALDEASP